MFVPGSIPSMILPGFKIYNNKLLSYINLARRMINTRTSQLIIWNPDKSGLE